MEMEILITKTTMSAGECNEASPPRQWKVSTRNEAYPSVYENQEVKNILIF